jgi:hypothetical protein
MCQPICPSIQNQNVSQIANKAKQISRSQPLAGKAGTFQTDDREGMKLRLTAWKCEEQAN